MNINIEQPQEGYIVIPCSEGYHICKLIELETSLQYTVFPEPVRTCFSGIASYITNVNTARRITPEEIVALIEEQEKRNGRERINDGTDQD